MFCHVQNELITYCLKTIREVKKILCLKLFFEPPYLDKRYKYLYVPRKGFTQQNVRKKHADQESKNKEVIEEIHERDLQKFRIVRSILDRAVQVSTT